MLPRSRRPDDVELLRRKIGKLQKDLDKLSTGIIKVEQDLDKMRKKADDIGTIFSAIKSEHLKLMEEVQKAARGLDAKRIPPVDAPKRMTIVDTQKRMTIVEPPKPPEPAQPPPSARSKQGTLTKIKEFAFGRSSIDEPRPPEKPVEQKPNPPSQAAQTSKGRPQTPTGPGNQPREPQPKPKPPNAWK